MKEIFIDIIIPVVAVVVGGIGASITIHIYYRNSQLQRAQWLYSLFEDFFCQSNYAQIRRLIDYNSQKEVERLRKALTTHSDEQLEEKMVDYLNFFEFIASLWLLRQLSIREICMMFDYYIRRLGDYDFVMDYLAREGFEGLVLLVAKVGELKDSE
jgi:hypothetical protein